MSHEPTFHWHQQRVEPFDEAEFYEPGAIVDITLDFRTVQIDRAGRACLAFSPGHRRNPAPFCAQCSGPCAAVELHTPAEFRERFPDGVTPDDGDGWSWENNGWFELYFDGECLDDSVAYSLGEAIDDAIERLRRAENDSYLLRKVGDFSAVPVR